jgi:hypothetical protein
LQIRDIPYWQYLDGMTKRIGGTMYALLREVTMIHPSKYRTPPDGTPDVPIYERGLNGERVFTFDRTPAPKVDTAAPKRYGIGYVRSDDELCIVPDIWSDDDAMCAHGAVWPTVWHEQP